MQKTLVVAVFIMVFLVFISTVLSLKQKFMEIRLSKLNKEIFHNYEQLQKLKAQWNYLNNKEYLEKLIDMYLPDLSKEITQSDLSKLRLRVDNTEDSYDEYK